MLGKDLFITSAPTTLVVRNSFDAFDAFDARQRLVINRVNYCEKSTRAAVACNRHVDIRDEEKTARLENSSQARVRTIGNSGESDGSKGREQSVAASVTRVVDCIRLYGL